MASRRIVKCITGSRWICRDPLPYKDIVPAPAFPSPGEFYRKVIKIQKKHVLREVRIMFPGKIQVIHVRVVKTYSTNYPNPGRIIPVIGK
jgi:hypothetical protein